MIVKRFSDFLINEKLDLVDLGSKLSDEYINLKKDLLEIIDKTLEKESSENVKNDDLYAFIDEYISKGKESNLITELISPNDLYNFYLKHNDEIDQLLNKTGYMKKSPIDNNVTELNDVIVDGTKQAIIEILGIIQKEIK